MRGLKVVLIILALFTLTAFIAAFAMPYQLSSLMSFPPSLTAFKPSNMFSTDGTNSNPMAINTNVANDMLSKFPDTMIIGTNGLQNDLFSNLLTTGLQNLPTTDQSNNLNMATQTPTATPYQTSTSTPTSTPTPTPTLAPTPAPTSTSQSLPAAGPNTYTDSDDGKTVAINNGDILHLRLKEYQALGTWQINTTDGLEVIGDTFYPDPIPNVPGGDFVNDGAGTRVYDIKATNTGVQKIIAANTDGYFEGKQQDYELTVNVV